MTYDDIWGEYTPVICPTTCVMKNCPHKKQHRKNSFCTKNQIEVFGANGESVICGDCVTEKELRALKLEKIASSSID